MAFDFPNAPTTGQIYQPTGGPLWQYDGEKWKGGAIAGPQKEQFFDIGGLALKDVPVPTWAKQARLTVNAFSSATAALFLRVSLDGSTYLAGATDYYWSGFYQLAGSAAPGITGGETATTGFNLTIGADNPALAHKAVGAINLTRPSTAQTFTYHGHGSSYINASKQANCFLQGYMPLGVLGSVLAIKSLRILMNTGSFGAGSTLHVEWLGDDAQMPTQNAIPDAPSDNGEYVRVNGVWRLMRQKIDMSGQFSVDVSVPTGANMVRLWGAWFPGVATNAGVRAAVSVDGTNFLTGASDYHYAGFSHYTQAPGTAVINHAPTLISYLYLSLQNHSNTTIPMHFDTMLGLTRSGTGVHFSTVTRAITWETTAQYIDTFLRLYVMNTNAGSSLDIKKIRFILGGGGTCAAPSYTMCEWVY